MTNLSTSFENPRVLGSIIRRQRLTLRANGKAVVQTPSALVRVRAPLFKETSLRAGFLLSGALADFWPSTLQHASSLLATFGFTFPLSNTLFLRSRLQYRLVFKLQLTLFPSCKPSW